MKHRTLPLIVAAWLVSAPAFAQADLGGVWAPLMHEDQPERGPGPEIGDYLGLPITDAMRLRAESWDASILTVPEHQCKPHPSTYGFRGVGNLRITNEIDPDTQQVTKIFTHIGWQEQEREIWMDGRPHPPDFAPHTWQGFSTGHWEGNVLVHVYIIEDPYDLTEPLIKTNGVRLTTDLTMGPYPCASVVEVVREDGEVPHHLPGKNPFVGTFATKHNVPAEAASGGAETALPEYMRKAK